MPTVTYPKNANSDTVFVEDGAQRTRAVKTVQPDGTIDYPTNPNSDSCYVTVDGEKQRALMVADISSAGTIDYPENSNSTKGYVTINGKKQRVVFTANIAGGGSAPVIDELNVTPSTSAQTITATGGTDGYSPVNVSAVDASIDANITAGNIKNGITILGVVGTYGGGGGPTYYIEKSTDGNGKLLNGSSIINLSGITDVGTDVLYAVYRNNTNIAGDFVASSITSFSGNNACANMFQSCTGLTGVDLSGLTTVSGISACNYMFTGCSYILSANLSSLTTISSSQGCAYMFNNCSRLATVNLSSLSDLSGAYACQGMFQYCNALTTLSFPAITTSSFGANNNQFRDMCKSIPNITLHFPSNVQSVIEGLTGYSATAPFGATAGTVLFDLPATS